MLDIAESRRRGRSPAGVPWSVLALGVELDPADLSTDKGLRRAVPVIARV